MNQFRSLNSVGASVHFVESATRDGPKGGDEPIHLHGEGVAHVGDVMIEDGSLEPVGSVGIHVMSRIRCAIQPN